MAEKCPVCGESVGGWRGKQSPFGELITQGQKAGVYVNGICKECLEKRIDEFLKQNPGMDIENKGFKVVLDVLPSVFVSPSPIPDGLPDMGLVTGYCILGTGPFTALCSGITDTFGMKSNAYMQKARDAEREALGALKIEALKKGADAVYCLRLNLTEATAGNGMIMITVTGAATSTGRDDPAIQKAIDYLKS